MWLGVPVKSSVTSGEAPFRVTVAVWLYPI